MLATSSYYLESFLSSKQSRDLLLTNQEPGFFSPLGTPLYITDEDVHGTTFYTTESSISRNVGSLYPSDCDTEYHVESADSVSSGALLEFHNWYKQYHGYLAAIICAFGIVANMLNIIVLTRKTMITATNMILTGLAISDGITMLLYLPLALRFYVLYGTEQSPLRNSLPAVRFMFANACISVFTHTVSVWLTVTLAVFRCVCVRHPRHAVRWCTPGRAKLAIVLVYLVSAVICLPNALNMRIEGERDCVMNGTYWIETISPHDYHTYDLCPAPHSFKIISHDDLIKSADYISSDGNTQVENPHFGNPSHNFTLTEIPTLNNPSGNLIGKFQALKFPEEISPCRMSSNANFSTDSPDGDGIIWTVRMKEKKIEDKVLYSVNFWLQAFLVKFLSSVLLTFLSVALIRTMKEADERSRTLRLASIATSKTDYRSSSLARGSLLDGAKRKQRREHRYNKQMKLAEEEEDKNCECYKQVSPSHQATPVSHQRSKKEDRFDVEIPMKVLNKEIEQENGSRDPSLHVKNSPKQKSLNSTKSEHCCYQCLWVKCSGKGSPQSTLVGVCVGKNDPQSTGAKNMKNNRKNCRCGKSAKKSDMGNSKKRGKPRLGNFVDGNSHVSETSEVGRLRQEEELRIEEASSYRANSVVSVEKSSPEGEGGKETDVKRQGAARLSSAELKKRMAKHRNTNRTTRMLLVVVVLFLVTEFPHGILSLLSGLHLTVFTETYMNLGDVMDILALMNSGINFLLYCSMSKQFRDHFSRLFLPTRSPSASNASRPARSAADSVPTVGPPQNRAINGRLAALHRGEKGIRAGQSEREKYREGREIQLFTKQDSITRADNALTEL